jgi:sugar lactone lactonase YvrE
MKTLKTIFALLFITIVSCSKNDDEFVKEIPKPTTYTVSTFAGGESGLLNGTTAMAQFKLPHNLIFDSNGNLFISDSENHQIRKITVDGIVSTLAGSTIGFANGFKSLAKFNKPIGMAFDANGNLYVADSENNKIRKITSEGLVSTFAGSTVGYEDNNIGILAKFNKPEGITIDATGNFYVTDKSNFKIRKISPTGVVTTLAGSDSGFLNATGINAKFSGPRGIILDNTGNLLVADSGNHKIRKITPSGEVTTFAGNSMGFQDGTLETTLFNFPTSLGKDLLGNIYVVDTLNHSIRKISSTGQVTTIAGSASGYQDGLGGDAKFSFPTDIKADNAGNLFIVDYGNNRIRKIVID